MANKSKSKGAEGYFAAYKSSKRWESNRIRRLERTLKAQPNNEQVKAALKGGLVYRRKTPVNRVWSASWIRVAKLFKEFGGRFDPAIMSSNADAAKSALQRQSKVAATFAAPTLLKNDSMFSLYARSNMRSKAA